MKKTIITIIVLIASGALIGIVLSGNKKKNEQKIEVINKGSGAAPVNIATVARQEIDLSFSSNGNFAPNQDLKMMSENSGRVIAIQVKEGDKVSKGQVLATTDGKYQALELQNAQDAYQKLKTDRERYESSLKTGGVTQAQLDEIDMQLKNAANRVEQARKRSGDAHIVAPISGVINKRYIEVGAYLSPGTSLFDIVDVSNLKLNLSVSERQVVQVKKGDKVSIKVSVFPDEVFAGTVSFISLKADDALKFPVEIRVDNNKSNLLRAGMYATATFPFQHQNRSIVVPRSAFVGSVHNNQVYVLNPDNTVALRNVTPGIIIGERVEILTGLQEGEKIVTTGQINLVDGAKVEIQKDDSTQK
jgi:membrane fusion protein (multidrug efflux system)